MREDIHTGFVGSVILCNNTTSTTRRISIPSVQEGHVKPERYVLVNTAIRGLSFEGKGALK